MVSDNGRNCLVDHTLQFGENRLGYPPIIAGLEGASPRTSCRLTARSLPRGILLFQ